MKSMFKNKNATMFILFSVFLLVAVSVAYERYYPMAPVSVEEKHFYPNVRELLKEYNMLKDKYIKERKDKEKGIFSEKGLDSRRIFSDLDKDTKKQFIEKYSVRDDGKIHVMVWVKKNLPLSLVEKAKLHTISKLQHKDTDSYTAYLTLEEVEALGKLEYVKMVKTGEKCFPFSPP